MDRLVRSNGFVWAWVLCAVVLAPACSNDSSTELAEKPRRQPSADEARVVPAVAHSQPSVSLGVVPVSHQFKPPPLPSVVGSDIHPPNRLDTTILRRLPPRAAQDAAPRELEFDSQHLPPPPVDEPADRSIRRLPDVERPMAATPLIRRLPAVNHDATEPGKLQPVFEVPVAQPAAPPHVAPPNPEPTVPDLEGPTLFDPAEPAPSVSDAEPAPTETLSVETPDLAAAVDAQKYADPRIAAEEDELVEPPVFRLPAIGACVSTRQPERSTAPSGDVTMGDVTTDDDVNDERVTTDESVTDERVTTDESVTDERVTDERVTDECRADESVIDEGVTDKGVPVGRLAEEPPTQEPAGIVTTDELEGNPPAAKAPPLDGSVSEQRGASLPVAVQRQPLLGRPELSPRWGADGGVQVPVTSEGREWAPVSLPIAALESSQRNLQHRRHVNDEVVARKVMALASKAEDLASRGAYYAARAEMIKALRAITQVLDSQSGGLEHSEALARALRAFREAGDFAPRGSQLEADLNLEQIISGHRTPILQDLNVDHMAPLAAQQRYLEYAQDQFAQSCAELPVGSYALYGLARIYAVMENSQLDSQTLCLPKAVTLHQAALLVDAGNVQAANELGVLLARFGQLEDARRVFLHALSIRPKAEIWMNLSVVHHRLGEVSLAQQAHEQGVRMARRQTGTVRPGTTSVQWVDPQTFSAIRPGPGQ